MRLRIKFNDGRKRLLEVKEWSTIHDIKNLINGMVQIRPESQRIFFRGKEVDNSWCVASAEDGCTLFCVVKNTSGHGTLSLCQSSAHTAKRLRELLEACKSGLAVNLKPLLALEGLGGTYFLRNSEKQCVACFKPRDEEPGGANNPRGLAGAEGQIAFERGIFAGDACGREMAAYLLDHNHFSGVPATAMAEACHPSFNHTPGSKNRPKLGMLQEYVVHDEVAGDVSPDLFPTREVHKIALLDIRCLNTDRNEGNILVQYMDSAQPPSGHKLPKWRRQNFGRSSPFRKGSSADINLVPIDHGYCFPRTFNIGWCDWCWIQWKQTRKPFDRETLEYIKKLDPDADSERLRKVTAINGDCLRNFKIGTLLLKQCAAKGLLLFEIADIMTRNNLDKMSDLEEAVERAQLMAKVFLKSPRARAMLSDGSGVPAVQLSPPKNTRISTPPRSGVATGASSSSTPTRSPNRNLLMSFETSPIQQPNATGATFNDGKRQVLSPVAEKGGVKCVSRSPGGTGNAMVFTFEEDNGPDMFSSREVRPPKLPEVPTTLPRAIPQEEIETAKFNIELNDGDDERDEEGEDAQNTAGIAMAIPALPKSIQASPLKLPESGKSVILSPMMITEEGEPSPIDIIAKQPSVRPRHDSLCTSDDESYHRSPSRARRKSFPSSDGSSSPRSPPKSPSSPRSPSLMAPVPLSRSFSYNEAMFSLPSLAMGGMYTGPRSLRHRRSGDNLEAVVADQKAYDRCFFTYLEKLFRDLIDLRLRARVKSSPTSAK